MRLRTRDPVQARSPTHSIPHSQSYQSKSSTFAVAIFRIPYPIMVGIRQRKFSEQSSPTNLYRYLNSTRRQTSISV